MKILKKLALAFSALVLIFGIIFVALGLILPDEILKKNEIAINSKPETVWQVINDREKFGEWAPNLEKVEIIDERKWREFPRGSDRPVIFEKVNAEKFSKYEIKYEMENLMAGEWRGTLEKTGNGTLLTTEDKLIHKSWFGKILMPLFFDLDSFAKEFNEKLKERAEGLK